MDDEDRLRALADSLDCVLDTDLRVFADITETTEKNWQKRSAGPAYILFGNRYLYPRKELREFLHAQIRQPHPRQAKAML